MRRVQMWVILGIGALLIAAKTDGCDSSGGEIDAVRAQDAITQRSNQHVGIPSVTNFTEKHAVRRLYELRDQNIATFTYVPNSQGRLWHVCDSIGFGLPYGVQFSSPLRAGEEHETHSRGNITLPQAEPNGLYMPPSDGTWVFCANGKHNDFYPIYVGARVVVSPVRLKTFGGWQIR